MLGQHFARRRPLDVTCALSDPVMINTGCRTRIDQITDLVAQQVSGGGFRHVVDGMAASRPPHQTRVCIGDRWVGRSRVRPISRTLRLLRRRSVGVASCDST